MKKPEETDTEAVKPPSPKWLEGDHHENSRQSKKHERRLAERLGGRRYAGSGNKRWSRHSRSDSTDKGDIATPRFHFEHKFTRADSMSVKQEWLAKVEEGAKLRFKDPGLIVTFQDQYGHPEDEWVAMPLDVFERLMAKVGEADDAER
jgi:hypothetical protein